MVDDVRMKNSTTAKMIHNTEKTLKVALEEKYKIKDQEKVDLLLGIHGLHRKNFDFIHNVGVMINSHINDISIDSNSNKGEKSIEAISQESIASVKKAVGYDYLFQMMRDLYGYYEANRLLGEMYDLSLALSDSVSILKPYCWSLDASDLVITGRNWGQLKCAPASNITDYTVQLCETCHQIASHLAGAIAVASYFLDLAHLLIYKENVDLNDLMFNREGIVDHIQNEMRQFVYSINNLSRNSNESLFINLSIFDSIKLKTLINDKSFFFPEIDGVANRVGYLVEYTARLQNIYLDFFDKGDPLAGGAPYRFPITTINLAQSEIDGELTVEDHEFLRNICKRDVYRYNIFCSKGTKIASCCRMISSSEMMDEYGAHANSFGGSGMSIGCFDDKTEVLTNQGWKLFKDLNKLELICTIDTKTKALEYQKPIEYFSYNYKGKMHSYKQRELDMLVTPNHNMLVQKRDSDILSIIQSDLIQNGGWDIPRVGMTINRFNVNKFDIYGDVYDADAFFEFVGLFVGDGSVLHDEKEAKKRAYTIHFQFKKSRKIDCIERILPLLGLEYEKHYVETRQTFNYVIYNRKLWEFLVKLGKCKEKHIPREMLDVGGANNLKHLFDGMMCADGCNNFYYTTSRQLASDFEELCVLLGYSFNEMVRQPRKICFKHDNNRTVTSSICYEISVLKTHERITRINRYKSEIDYDGKIYCLEVPNHTMVVRRNGTVMVSGNSHRVVTINFPRIAMEASTEQDFYHILEERITSCAKILRAHKDLIKLLEKKGLQPFITNHYIRMDRLFSTFGIIGIFEAATLFKEKFGNGRDVEAKMLTFMNDKVRQASEKYGIMSNIEQIPGESFASRLARADKVVMGQDRWDIYSNQFIPLTQEATLWQRLAEDGKYNSLITGGGIVHAQIGERVTSLQAEKIIKFAIKVGCEHFALNPVYTICDKGHVHFGKLLICPSCSSTKVDYMTRIIGYFTKVSNWHKDRREEFPRRTFVNVEQPVAILESVEVHHD